MGRPKIDPKTRNELSALSAELIGEITANSGMTPEGLEKSFGKYAGDGRQWRKLRSGSALLDEHNLKEIGGEALARGWLSPETGIDLVLSVVEADEDARRKAAAKKIEKHLAQVINILRHEMPGNDVTQMLYIRKIGFRLEDMYLADEDVSFDTDGITPASILAQIFENAPKEQIPHLLQICSNEIKKP